MTTQELEIVSGGTVPWAAISVGIVGSKPTYDLSYAAGKIFLQSRTLIKELNFN